MTIKSADRFISASKNNYKDFLKVNLLAGMLCNKLDYADYFVAFSQDRLWFYDENGDKTIMKSDEVYNQAVENGFWDLLYGYKQEDKKVIYKKIKEYVVDQIISIREKDLDYYDEDSNEYLVAFNELNDITFLADLANDTISEFYNARDEAVYSLEYKTIEQDCKDYINEVKQKYIDQFLKNHSLPSMNYSGDGSSPKKKERSL